MFPSTRVLSTCAILAALSSTECRPDLRPPESTTPVLAAVEAPFASICGQTVRPQASYVLDCDGGVWRLASGGAWSLATGAPTSDAGYLLFAVGDDESVWVAESSLRVWNGTAWSTHDLSTASGLSEVYVPAVAARNKDDAYAIVDPVGSDGQQLCHWNGATWTCEGGIWDSKAILLTPSQVFLVDNNNEMRQRASDGTWPMVVDTFYNSVVAVLGDDMFFHDSYGGLLWHWNGETLEQVEGVTGSGFVVRAIDDIWTWDAEEESTCTESNFLGCTETLSFWRRYRIKHWDGASLAEVGHIDRLMDSDDPDFVGYANGTFLVAGATSVWLDVEGWVEASR